MDAFSRHAAAAGTRPLAQAAVKRVVVHVVDDLVANVHGRKLRKRHLLYANRVQKLDLKATTHQSLEGESMLDVAVYAKGSGPFGDPYTLIATAESEAFANHGVEDHAWDWSDYRWDLFKLLAVPSPLRLFVARTTRKKRGVPLDRVAALRGRVADAVRAYSHGSSRSFHEDDRIFSIVLPASGSYADVECDGWRIEAGVALAIKSTPVAG